MSLEEAKSALDKIIRKSRIHLYKPIQIAEILYRHRSRGGFDVATLESYRNASKKWRDRVSSRLVGRVSTSSQKFQDNIFEKNAMPPRLLALLARENEKPDRAGIVEKYIYAAFKNKMATLDALAKIVREAKPGTFEVRLFIQGFRRDPGLKRSIDKAYEIAVYALFDSIVTHLEATVTLKVSSERLEILRDFEDFTGILLGVTSKNPEFTTPARLYRAGVTNAADRGLDMWANFGPAIQVKHLSLTEKIAEDMATQIKADRIVIVCQAAEQETIKRVLEQVGFADRIQGIITQTDLEAWYKKCFSKRYSSTLGTSLLKSLSMEFESEFPSTGGELDRFVAERGYDKIELTDAWCAE